MSLFFITSSLCWLVLGLYFRKTEKSSALSRAMLWLCLASSAWLLTLYNGGLLSNSTWLAASHSLEVLRLFAWWNLVQALTNQKLLNARTGALGMGNIRTLFLICLAVILYSGWSNLLHLPSFLSTITGSALTIAAMVPLIAAEQMYRNLDSEQRWAIKFIMLAVFISTAVDLACHVFTLLYGKVEPQLWLARGPISLITAALLFIGMRRALRRPTSLSLSHQLVFYTGTLTTVALFLIFVSAGAWYIRHWGGQWSTVLLALFLGAALALIASAILSGRFRARLQVFFSRHFLPYHYDHRAEWLRLSDTLSKGAEHNSGAETVLKALADIVDSPAGLLLTIRNHQLQPTAAWNMPAPNTALPLTTTQIEQMVNHQWIYNRDADKPNKLPEWFSSLPRAWLAIPLLDPHGVIALIVLAAPRAKRHLNWEDYDLLKVAARHASAVIAHLHASEALADARHFAALHQSTAFLVHDIKTVVAQLSLLSRNAEKHRNNPDFFDDMLETVRHSVGKMERILTQLRQPTSSSAQAIEPVNIINILHNAVNRLNRFTPTPVLSAPDEPILIKASDTDLETVFGHLIRNAQEACDNHQQANSQTQSQVNIEVEIQPKTVHIHIRDNGKGMTAQFIQEQLFSPFSSTKGVSGMGIGAYQSRTLIENIGGKLLIESRPKQGSCFTIVLNRFLPDRSD